MIKDNVRIADENKFHYPPILSFFTGAGFLDLGFCLAGFPVVWRNEFCQKFVQGFEYGMASMGRKDKIDNTFSIVDLGPNQISKEAFNNLPRPDVFGIIGGPPCPDFSVGGKNRGQEGERGRLSLIYTNRILELQPTFFMFENVPGLLRTSKHRQFLSHLMTLFSKKYFLDLRVVNALDYGVPQDRERMIMVGFSKRWVSKNLGISTSKIDAHNKGLIIHLKSSPDKFAHSWFPWHKGRKYEDVKTNYDWPDKNPFGSDVKKPKDLPEDLMVGPLICDQKVLKRLKNSDEAFIPYSDKFKIILEGDVSRKCFKRLHRWRYSPAAAYGNNEVHLHPILPRRLSVREAMRIQTVPDSYAFPKEMSLTHKFKTIGNGVPVRLAKAIAAGFSAVLKGEINEHF